MRTIIFGFTVLLLTASLKSQTFTFVAQPGSTGFDATNSSSAPTTNNGNSTTIRASRANTDNGNIYERSLLKFDLSTISPGVNIISAKLILYGNNHSTSNGGGVLQMVPAAWTESTTTWNNSTLLKSATMPSISIASPTSATQNFTLDVTSMVQTMVNAPLINFGWLLYLADEASTTSGNYDFISSDNRSSNKPRMEITYSNPLTVNAYVTPATDASSTDGGIYLSVNQGVPPYTYLWSNSATTKDIYNVARGVYTVTITDNSGFATSKIIPVCSESVTSTFTITSAPSTMDEALLLYESLNANTANTNFEKYSNITTYNVTSGAGTKLARSLLAFDLKSLPNNATINTASLVLRDNQTTQATSFPVQLCRSGAAWNGKTVTYNNQPDYINDTTDIVQFSYDGSLTDYVINVTNQMQKMVTQVNSSFGWLLKMRDETSASLGRSVAFLGNNQSTGPKPSLVLQITLPYSADLSRNWHMEETYDENGNVISTEKTYIDALGRAQQSLSKNATNEVFRTQTVYDSYGRPALTTMPAFSGNALIYHTGFMRNQTAQVFSYTDFDTPTTLNNPTAIENNIANTLGYYYSNNNTYDAFQATADNPYTRREYTGNPGGTTRRVSSPGNAFKMGSGKESYSFSMISGDELKNVFGSNYYYKCKRDSSDYNNSVPLTTSQPILASKHIDITPDNREIITYNVGGKTIATCFAGVSSGELCAFSAVENKMYYSGTMSTDIHLPDANKGSLVIPAPLQATSPNTTTAYSDITFTITDLFTDKKLIAGTDYNLNTSTGAVTFNSPFTSLYTGKSVVLRISFTYGAAYEASLLAANVTPADIKVQYSLSYGRFSKNYYDIGGALRKSVSPKGFNCGTPASISMATTYDYDHYGQTIAQKTPDEGLTEFVYDKKGKLRFTQNADQKLGNRFSYLNYDVHGRLVESGEYKSVNGSGNAWFDNYYLSGPTSGTVGITCSSILNSSDGLTTSGKTNTTITGYSSPTGTSNDIPSAWSYYGNYQKFRNGAVNFIKNKNSTVWYNYDEVGRQKSTITQITEADFATYSSALNSQIKTTESSFNYFTGLSTGTIYQANYSNEYMYYTYNYDANYRPTTTTLQYGSTNVTLSSNSYNKIGQLKRVVLGNNFQGIDYIYMLNGQLKAINHPGLDPTLDPGGATDIDSYNGSSNHVNKDLFGEILDYYYNDYQRNNTNIISSVSSGSSLYNGLINTVRFKTRQTVNGTATGMDYIDYLGSNQTQITSSTNYQQQELAFKYTYDEFNQLAKTGFNTYNNSSNAFTSRSEYAEAGASGANINYDKNGNITRLTRMAFNSVTLDNLSYTINSNDNRLSSILDAASNTYPSSFNFKTPSTSSPSSFGYNSIGQLTVSAAEGIDSIYYYPSGKIRRIKFSNSNYTDYQYGALGEKLRSKYYNNSTNKYKYNWYIGPTIYEVDQAVSTTNFNVVEVSVPTGVIRVNGLASNAIDASGYLVYYIKDHLGNVRATFKPTNQGVNNGIAILSATDYYAFGGQLPGRIWNSETPRSNYQGQEKLADGSNPWIQFELRNYNQDIGRWFAPDPYQQFASPYVAMANNPVSMTDPNGGQVNAAPAYGKQFWGKLEMDRQRQQRTGAFSPDAVQARYNDEYKNLYDHFMSNDYGRRGDISGMLRGVRELNNQYYGLSYSFDFSNWGMITFQTGTGNLTVSEADNNNWDVYDNKKQTAGWTPEKTIQTYCDAGSNDYEMVYVTNGSDVSDHDLGRTTVSSAWYAQEGQRDSKENGEHDDRLLGISSHSEWGNASQQDSWNVINTNNNSGSGVPDYIGPGPGNIPLQVINDYEGSVYFKPEGDLKTQGFTYKNDGAYKMGKASYVPLDGVNVNGKVTKITGGYNLIHITKTGEVNPYYYQLYPQIGYWIKGGELAEAPDPSWNNLFNPQP